jgi:hypothetical protein
MRKLIVLSLLTAIVLLAAGFSTATHAQTPPNDLKPTFISPTPTPGLYVNGWPAFTVTYPKEWVEAPLLGPFSVFRVGVARPDLSPPTFMPSLAIIVVPNPLPLEEWAKWFMPTFLQFGTDIKVLSDKPTQLKDGTPARELEIEYAEKTTGRKANQFGLMAKKGLVWVTIWLNTTEKASEDLKKIASSITFQPDREKPVQVPPDVRAFLDMYCADMVSGDVKAVMVHFSDRFLWGGMSKPFAEQVFRNDPNSPLRQGLISYEATVTVFEPRGDKAYVDGFFLQKTKGDTNAVKIPIFFQQIINEHGQWKWFGNQK